jgi:putative ATP-dependent endonuclease of OLD family
LTALALIFSPDASNFSQQLLADDIWTNWRQENRLPVVKIQATIAGLETVEEKALVAKWLINSRDELKARITYEYRSLTEREGELPEVLPIDDYDWIIYGGEVERERIDFKDLAQIRLELLPALRDAEREMSRGARRRLGSLISRFKPEGFDEEDVPDKRRIRRALLLLNARLEQTEPVAESQRQLNIRLGEVSGDSNKQQAAFRPSKLEFDDLIRNLVVLIGTQEGLEHGVELNGLGYNNLLYVGALLTDFYQRRKLQGPKGITLPIVAIEEPEAHLHPHLQKFLNRYFAESGDGQVIVTTHSTHVSSSVDPSHIVVLYRDSQGGICAASVANLFQDSRRSQRQLDALRRYLDATRSTLFFGKSVILVEGLSEAILLPVIAKESLGFDVDDKGMSIVAVQGISFRPFAALFGPEGIRRRCAILADSDPGEDSFPINRDDPDYQPAQRVVNLQAEMDRGKRNYVKVFSNLKTLEHDVIVSGNREIVEKALGIAVDLSDKITQPKVEEAIEQHDQKAFSQAVLQVISGAKGAFAQALAEAIADDGSSFRVPDYISDAFSFLLNQDEADESDD